MRVDFRTMRGPVPFISKNSLTECFKERVIDFTCQLYGTFTCELWCLAVEFSFGVKKYALKRPKPGMPDDTLSAERRFYQTWGSQLPASPQYYGWLAREHALLLDWVEGLEHFDFFKGPGKIHEQGAIDALAQLHRIDVPSSLDWLPNFSNTGFVESIAADYKEAWAARRDWLSTFYDGFLTQGDELVDSLAAKLLALGAKPCLLHGDAHLENLPLGVGGGVCMLDWQDPMLGGYGVDMADMLLMSYPIEDRRSRERELIARHAGLMGVDFSDAWELYSLGITQRVARTVRQAHRNPKWGESSLPWIFKRCATAAVDHL